MGGGREREGGGRREKKREKMKERERWEGGVGEVGETADRGGRVRVRG